MRPPWQAALLRFLRVVAGQVAAAALQSMALNLGLLNLTPQQTVLLGAVINLAGKYLRDKYGWEWTP